jgi:hypothetical protein
MNLHRSKFCHLLFAISVVILTGFYILRNWGFAHDDSYITFRYADNWLKGFGLRFNPTEVYYGTTAAGYAVILAAFSSLFSELATLFNPEFTTYFTIPNISVVVSALSVATIIVVAYLMTSGLKAEHRLVVGLMGAVCLFTSYLFESAVGHETNLFVSALFMSSYLIFFCKRFALGAVTLFLATAIRPDAGLTAGLIVSVMYSLKDGALGGAWRRTAVIYLSLLALWLIFVKINLGSFLPGTMLAKKAQVTIGYWPLFDIQHSGVKIFDFLGLRGAIFVFSGVLAFFVCMGTRIKLIHLRDYQLTLFVFFAGQLLSYLAYLMLNVTYWSWYGIPPAAGLLCLGAVGWLTALHRLGSGEWPEEIKRAAYVLLALFGTVIAYPELQYSHSWSTTRHINTHLAVYDQVVEFIKRDAPNGAVIQMNEPGRFGYLLGPKYKINDELGLVTPGVAEALIKRNYRYLYRKENPDYLLCSWGGKYTLCHSRKLNKQYKLVGEFDSDFWKNTYVKSGSKLYKRVGG